jgi:hypothetical protein
LSRRNVEEALEAIFGVNDHVSALQECARAVLIFVYGLAMRNAEAQWEEARRECLDGAALPY